MLQRGKGSGQRDNLVLPPFPFGILLLSTYSLECLLHFHVGWMSIESNLLKIHVSHCFLENLLIYKIIDFFEFKKQHYEVLIILSSPLHYFCCHKYIFKMYLYFTKPICVALMHSCSNSWSQTTNILIATL